MNMPEKITDALSSAMREEFIFGYTDATGVRVYPSIDSLVKKHNVARATLYRHVEKENWQGQKNQIQTEIEQKLDDERVTKLLKEGKKLDDTALAIAQGMLTSVGRKLQKGFQDEQNNPVDGGLAETLLRDLSQTAINAQKLGKLALGQAQEISKVSADVSSPEAFREIMEQLDEIAESRSSSHNHSLQ